MALALLPVNTFLMIEGSDFDQNEETGDMTGVRGAEQNWGA